MNLIEIIGDNNYTTKGRSIIAPKIIANPFPSSVIKQEMYHGGSRGIKQFRRPAEGVWFADNPEWCKDLYTRDGKGKVYVCWVNVRNPYMPTEEEEDRYYGEMDIIGDFFNKLRKQGFDSYFQGGESGSIAVFESVEIVNAYTGLTM